MHRQDNNPGKRPKVSTSEQPGKHQKVDSVLVQNLLHSNQQIRNLFATYNQSNDITAFTTQRPTPGSTPTPGATTPATILAFNPNLDEAFKEKFKIKKEQEKEQLLKMLNHDDPWLSDLATATQNEIINRKRRKVGEKSKIGVGGTIKVKISPKLCEWVKNLEPSQQDLLGIYKFHLDKKDNDYVEISLPTAESWLEIILPKIEYITPKSRPPAKIVRRIKEKKVSVQLAEENTTEFELMQNPSSLDEETMTSAHKRDFQVDSINAELLNTAQNVFMGQHPSFYESKILLFPAEKDDLTNDKEELLDDKVDNSFADSFLNI